MKKIITIFINIFFIFINAQQVEKIKQKGHYNESSYKELDEILPTPNTYRTAAGAPGKDYYQQKADYDISIELDEPNNRIFGEETITYHNFSPDTLEYLWVQLDQNINKTNSPSKLIVNGGVPKPITPAKFSEDFIEPIFDGGFNLEYVKDTKNKDLNIVINYTMMRVHLETPLKPNQSYKFKIKWWYNINDYYKIGGESGRSGFEPFSDGNKIYVIAQFYPRMAVYNDVEGWQNMQFWGRSEFALPFGDFKVSVTLPADHVINGTGEITNLKQNLTPIQWKRWNEAHSNFDKPTLIITPQEAKENEKLRLKTKKTWKFDAKNVRDFAFSASRKFIWDAMNVKVGEKEVMAISLYPNESNPLWEKYSTRTVAHTLKEYSKYTFDYPYSKAISVSAEKQGMEYPMICWNYGRPDKDGTYSDRVKHGMISVIIHEIGHNFFPMIVNSDERQWTWMDEGLNTFLQFLTEQNMEASFPNEYNKNKKYPSRRGFPKDVVEYMSLNQDDLQPIMTQGDHVTNFGAHSYGKPATGLAILRNTILGKDLFDYAFKTYATRWKFKHPTPADFFRTMEDASGTDLDWFFRGWFFTTQYCDISINDIKKFQVKEIEDKNKKMFEFIPTLDSIQAFDYKSYENLIKEVDKLSENDKSKINQPKYFYEVEYQRVGELIMPLLVTFKFKDGTEQEIRYPYMTWKQKEASRIIKKFYAFHKELAEITIDKNLETADTDTSNNTKKL